MLKPLTSLRFIAALMVFAWHISFHREYQLGIAGVSFFFVLSGFILTYNYSTKFNELTIKNLKEYYVARFSKIYPICFFTFLVSIPYAYMEIKAAHPENFPVILSMIKKAMFHLSLTQSYMPRSDVYYSFNWVSWSLSDEALFYLILPFIIFISVLASKYLTAVRLTYLLTGIIVFSIIYLLGVQNITISSWRYYIFPFDRLLDFFAGTLLGLLFKKIVPTIESSQTKKYDYTIIEVLTIIIVIGAVLVSPNIPQQLRFGAYYLPFWCIAISVFALQKGRISWILSQRPFVFLGEISFSFYMIHFLVLRYTGVYGPYITFIKGHQMYIFIFFVSLILSIIMYLCIEEPMRKLIRYRLFKRKNKPFPTITKQAVIKIT